MTARMSGRMRAWAVLLLGLVGCPPPDPVAPSTFGRGPVEVPVTQIETDPSNPGKLDDRLIDWVFDGGQVEFELYRRGTRIVQIARNRFATPLVIRWNVTGLDNLEPLSATEGVAYLPAAPTPYGLGQNVILAEFDQMDTNRRYRRELYFRARWGDPRAEPTDYVYRLPYAAGLTFSVLQGFHGSFSHRGSNEFAVDFDCPVATQVLAARPGVVVAANAAAQGSGTTSDFLDYRRTNFVLVQHDDGTLGEYMHLSPSGIEVKPGQRVERGTPLALSGNTGFSSTPHLHFHVMTSADDGMTARSFSFRFAAGPKRIEEPVQGRSYSSWEPTASVR
jgi:murein DD-endopeptidase MepM/ murein hydrolase activator NlpD